MKKILTLLALIVLSCMGAWAETVTITRTSNFTDLTAGREVYFRMQESPQKYFGGTSLVDEFSNDCWFTLVASGSNFKLKNRGNKYVKIAITNHSTQGNDNSTFSLVSDVNEATEFQFSSINGGFSGFQIIVVCSNDSGNAGHVLSNNNSSLDTYYYATGPNANSWKYVSWFAYYENTPTGDPVVVNSGETKSVSEFATASSITVMNGGTLNIDANYPTTNIDAENGANFIISNTGVNIAALTGEVNVAINVDYTISGNKTTQATGKLTINSGKQLSIGTGDTETNSLASFTSVQVYGTIYNKNKTSVLSNVTFEDGSIFNSNDMGVPGDNADSGTYENALRFAGTTTINGNVTSISYWNAQYTIDKLAGSGTLKIRGNSATSENTHNSEATYFTISNTEDFTGNLDITNTAARIMPISGVNITNAVKVNTATLNNVTIVGNERINTAGNVTINGVASNDLTYSSHGYAFVGGGTINLAGTMDLTKNGTSNHSRVGYGAGTHVNILDGADVTTAGVYNSSTASSNTELTIGVGATLTTTDHTSSPNFTNNGTIKLVDLSGTHYTAATVSGATFNVAVSEDVLSSMSNASYTVVTGVTTNNVTAYTLNGESNVILNGYVYTVKQAEDGNNIVLTREQLSYSATITAGNNGNFGTLCLPYATTVPTGVDAYTLTTLENDHIAFTKAYAAGSILPAEEPVLIVSENAGSYNFVGTTNAAKVGTNIFLGTPNAEQVDMSGNDIYVLAMDEGNICFMRTTATNVNPYKAYIKTSAISSAKAIKINFDEVVTAINGITNSGENTIFDLCGRKVNNARSGFYIVNGKKVLR